MTTEKDGGPAFPCEVGMGGQMLQTGNQQWLHQGATLRDYFAIKALPELIRDAADLMDCGSMNHIRHALSTKAYLWADAMLLARRK